MPGPKSLVVGLFFISALQATLLLTAEAQVHHAIPPNQLKRRSTKHHDHLILKPYIPIFDWEQQQYVKAHNDLRAKVRVPPLRWNPDLAKYSHYWATQLLNDCNYRNHSHGKYGENIFWSLYKEFSPADVVSKWFSEQIHFDHKLNMCKCQPETDACECGHYLNIIWKATQSVGCSDTLYCHEEKGVIVVCEYDPPGNYKGLDPLNPSPRSLMSDDPSPVGHSKTPGDPLPINSPKASRPLPAGNSGTESGAQAHINSPKAFSPLPTVNNSTASGGQARINSRRASDPPPENKIPRASGPPPLIKSLKLFGNQTPKKRTRVRV